MNSTSFRKRIEGPEAVLEDSVLSCITKLFAHREWPQWIGRSVPLGCGLPDLVSVWYNPKAELISDFTPLDGSLLGYLRTVRNARAETIADRINRAPKLTRDSLDKLLTFNAIEKKHSDVYSMTSEWRHVLTSIVAIEAKISDWKNAVQQAARNRIFAHQSFVAFPEKMALRIEREPIFSTLGIGIISVSNAGCVHILQEAPHHKTGVWAYYYQLAGMAAKYGLHRSTRCHSKTIS